MIVKEEESIQIIDGIKYKIVYNVTSFDDPPDEFGKAKEPIMVEISREVVILDKDKIIELQDKIAEMEARILELESKSI